MWSAAPGIYMEYDYEGAAEFNKHILPQQISIFEGGELVVQARVESFGAPGEIDPNTFKPGPEMTDAGESFTLSGPRRFPMRELPNMCADCCPGASGGATNTAWLNQQSSV